MAVKLINECVGCPPEMGCLGSACPHRNIPVFSCDQCGDDGDIYEYEGQHYCPSCLLDLFDKVQEG